jgi:hypothetical protein
MKQIIIFDDEVESRATFKQRLSALPKITEQYEVYYADETEFREAVGALERRRQSARSGAGNVEWGPDTLFDRATILVIDYDLLYFDRTDNGSAATYLTGEAVSYLARCYSRCGFIIALNQFGNTFDLTLRGHPESFADLNLSQEQLDNDVLWIPKKRGFRPWYWRLVPAASERLERCAELITGHADELLVNILQIPPAIVPLLPRSVTQFVEGAGSFEATTIRSFVEESQQGLRGKDAVLNPDAVARIAAARLHKWLERIVLPGQDILVDAPHLVARMPSLLGGPRGISAWNKTALFGAEPTFEAAAAHVWHADAWISRPVWWWQTLRDDQSIMEVSSPWRAARAEFAFCEDVSEFAAPDQVMEFVADVDSPFVRRFVVKPESKLASELRLSRDAVEYRPAVRFAM